MKDRHAQAPVAWRITFKSESDPDGFSSVHYHGTNAIADYRVIDPDAVSEPLYLSQENEEIKRQRDELLNVFRIVIAEMEHRDRCDGNAPGHGHKTPGIWDSDNGKLAGAPCAWCATWSKAKELCAAIASAKGGAA